MPNLKNKNESQDSKSDTSSDSEDEFYSLQEDRDTYLKGEITKLEKRDVDFIQIIQKGLTDLKFYAKPIKFKRDPDQSVDKIFMCMEGEIGVGKSTTNNHILDSYCKLNGLNLNEQDAFKFGRQCERVTTTVKTKQIGNLSVMDTPGTNDFQSDLSDYTIQKMKHQSLTRNFADKFRGVSCITQCIMVDNGGRLKETSMESMARTLHALTYSFPEYDPQTDKGPRLNVFFSKLSKFIHEEDDIMIDGLHSESKFNDINPFDELVKKFKMELAKKIHDDIGQTETLEMTEFKVDLILPKDHFYGFKIFPGNPEKMIKEKTEIVRLINDAKEHGRWYIENKDYACNTPCTFDSDQAKLLIEKIQSFSQNIVDNQVKITQESYRSQTLSDKVNKKIVEDHKLFQQGFTDFQNLAEKCPWVFQRLPSESQTFIDKAAIHFPLYMRQVLASEVRDFYIKQSKQKSLEINNLHKEISKMERDHTEYNNKRVNIFRMTNAVVKSYHAKQLEKLRIAQSMEIKAMEEQMDQQEKKFMEKIENEHAKIKNSNVNISNQCRAKIDQIQANRKVELAATISSYKEKLAAFEKSHQTELSNLNASKELAVQNLTSDYAQKVINIQNANAMKLKKLSESKISQKYDLVQEIKKMEYDFNQAKIKEDAAHKINFENLQKEANNKLYSANMKIKKLESQIEHLK